MALVKGSWKPGDEVPVRVHEPFSAIDLLDVVLRQALVAAAAGAGRDREARPAAWRCCSIAASRPTIWCAQLMPEADPCEPRARRPVDLRTYGVGAQILRELGVTRMQLLGQPRRMPSMTGYGLEVTSFITTPAATAARLSGLGCSATRLRSGTLTATRLVLFPELHRCKLLIKAPPTDLDGHDLVIGIVRARFNDAITSRMAEACKAELLALGVLGQAHHASSPCRARSRCRSR